MFEEETEQALFELSDSDHCSTSSDHESSGTDDLAVNEVIAMECSDEDDIVQGASAPSATSAMFTWEDMTNYVGQREQFSGNCGPQNEARNEINCAKVFKMYFTDELVDIIVRETNTYAEQKIRVRSLISFRLRMRDWKPVTTDKMYVVIALFMLMGIIQKPTL
jgi:hypothetical protein